MDVHKVDFSLGKAVKAVENTPKENTPKNVESGYPDYRVVVHGFTVKVNNREVNR